MSKIKLNLKQLAFTEKTDKARDIVSALQGNPSFATPIPSLDTVTTAINACDAAFAASRVARQEVKTRNSERGIRGDDQSERERVCTGEWLDRARLMFRMYQGEDVNAG